MNSAMKWMWKKPSQLCAKGCNLEITEVSCVNTALTQLTPHHNGALEVSQPSTFCFLIQLMKTPVEEIKSERHQTVCPMSVDSREMEMCCQAAI